MTAVKDGGYQSVGDPERPSGLTGMVFSGGGVLAKH